ncbi:MAG: membrane integrity-associated transporter subunit PqiC [Deltaproteobacteria bacterium]|nr:membrane integrity-associated transporter subunit PqiC [Deltaproteobacteria bacterium]
MKCFLLLVVVVVAAACGGKVPQTRYYQLAAPTTAARGDGAVIVLEQLATDAGYDDERIVYRTTPYRMDYYDYHRWSASPGVVVGNYLEQALERSGRFRAVIREVSDQAAIVLGGRVVALEEIDRSKARWVGRIVIELTAADPRTNEILWTEQFEEIEPLAVQSPEGLAQAITKAMSRIVAKAAPQIADHADRQAALHAAEPAMARGK